MATQIALEFNGLQNSKAESKVAQGYAWSMQNCFVDNGILEVSKRYALFGARTGTASGDIGWGMGYGAYSGDEVQTISLTGLVTGGTFTVRWRPDTSTPCETTSTIPYNATASGFQVLFETLTTIDPGDVRVTGGPLPSKLKIQFQKQYANQNLEPIELVTNSLQGSNPNVEIQEEIKGGASEEYLAVVQHAGASDATLYTVNALTGVYTLSASGLHASDWYFEQYQQRIWAVNRVDGLNFKTIGGTWNNGVSGEKPVSPALKPTFNEVVTNATMDWTSGVTISATGLASYTTMATAGAGVYVKNTGASLSPGSEVTIEIVYAAAQDWSHRDFYLNTFGTVGSGLTMFAPRSQFMTLINQADTRIEPINNYWTGDQPYSLLVEHWCTFANSNRSARATVKKVRFKFIVGNWAQNQWAQIASTQGHVWESDRLPLFFGDSNNPPKQTKAKNEYGYTYWDDSGQIESDMSPTDSTGEIPTQIYGCWNTLTLAGSQELTSSDRIYVYRKRKVDGSWRRLPQDALNASVYGVPNVSGGTTTFTDKWMEEELADFPTQESSGFPAAGTGIYADQIGTWKQCLCIGANKQVWISYVGQPQRFVPSPDDTEAVLPGEDEEDRGKTEYVSDNRSEDVYGIHGQDSLYLVTPRSTYSIVGDSPGQSTPPRRLPHSRGTLGKRSSNILGGGIFSAAEDGFWYYSVGRGFSGEDNGSLVAREETENVRRSYSTTFLGGSLSASGTIVVEYNNEFWLFNGTRYMVKTRNDQWLEGTYGASVKAVQPVRHFPLRFLDSRGRVYSISSSYKSDDGDTVEWQYKTGLLDGNRTRIRALQIRGDGNPQVYITVWDGNNGQQAQTLSAERLGENYRFPINLQPGFRYQLEFRGVGGVDTVEVATLTVDSVGDGSGN